jgi:hypothetical protein
MLRIEIKSQLDRMDLYRTSPKEEHAENLISESCEVFYGGRKWFTYLTDQRMEDLREAVLAIKNIGSNRRQSGVASKSRVFGYMPRMPVQQQDYCKSSSLHREYPKSKELLFKYSERFSTLLKEHYLEQWELSQRACQTVKPDWVMPGGCFTSGIINYDNPLNYHYDAGNFEGTWSVMATFKNKTGGGNLILPEYNLKLACQDSSLCIFDGQSELHGVSPIVRLAEDSYRYTCVFYSLESLCKCGTPKEELRRAQVSRTKTEMKRAGLGPELEK